MNTAVSLKECGSNAPNRIVYLGPWEDHPNDSASIMRFRLTYDGELKASQRDPVGGQVNKLAEHKQSIRKVFHRQLKRLWETNQFLKNHQIFATDYATGRSSPDDAETYDRNTRHNNYQLFLMDAVADQYQEHGYRFVPLVREDYSLLCSLDIMFLRRDIPGSVIAAGDLDNRIKTLIDALRRPQNSNELKGNESPADDENPFFCLLEDDKLVTALSVETDTLLDPSTGNADGDARMVKLIITVDLKPYDVTTFNLGFS